MAIIIIIIRLVQKYRTEDTLHYAKNSIYEKIERVFDEFPKYRTKMLLGGLIDKIGRKDIFNRLSFPLLPGNK
jgi:hypothetical protein